MERLQIYLMAERERAPGSNACGAARAPSLQPHVARRASLHEPDDAMALALNGQRWRRCWPRSRKSARGLGFGRTLLENAVASGRELLLIGCDKGLCPFTSQEIAHAKTECFRVRVRVGHHMTGQRTVLRLVTQLDADRRLPIQRVPGTLGPYISRYWRLSRFHRSARKIDNLQS